MSWSNEVTSWIDQHGSLLHFGVAAGLITLVLGVAVVSLWRNNPEDHRRPDWSWAGLIILFLLAGRWPTFLVNREFNPDEGQLLAGAHTLVHDPVFWRSIDGGTSGPLNFFALWPAAWLCGWQWQGYLPARLTAFGFIAGSFILANEILALLVGRRVARLAILPALCLEALTNSIDLLHYSTELLPMLLLAIALYAAVRRWRPGGSAGWNALGGLALGAVVLTKLQAVPLAGVFGLAWLVAELLPAQSAQPGLGRRLFHLVGAALLPAALLALQLTVTGEWPDMIICYITWNLHYSSDGVVSYAQLLGYILNNSINQDSLLHLWLAGTAAALAVLGIMGRTRDRSLGIFTGSMFLGCALALFCVVFPHRPFLHYWQLLVLPATLLGGALAGRVLARPPGSRPWLPRALVAGCFCAIICVLVRQRALQPNRLAGGLAYFRENPHSEIARQVGRHVRPGDAAAVWGWTNCIYAETGLRQAARDAMVERLIEPGPLQGYFRQRYLDDFRRTMPPIFVDSTGPWSLRYQDPAFRHENVFPEFAAIIRAGYVLVDEVGGARIYLRRDRAAPRP